MPIERVIVKNYRALRQADVPFNEHVNIVVGNNEAGKSTLLEAINLALRCQLNRRAAQYELHPFLINVDAVAEFVAAHKKGKPIPPPEAMVEVYLKSTPDVAELVGSINSQKSNSAGICLTIRLDENCLDQYKAFVSDTGALNSIPIEYYEVVWTAFSGAPLSTHSVPVKSALIDPGNSTNSFTANKYVLEIVRDYLSKAQAGELALAYRTMRDRFQEDPRIEAINKELGTKKGVVSSKTLSVSMDTTTRASWETGVMPHLDDIPLTLVGKGEQNSVKIKLAIEAANGCDIFLIEEPENHLSHTNLGRLVSHLAERCKGKQLLISTHSSFVLNKLGIDHILMFNGETGVTLDHLNAETKAYFQRLPGHDTLRMILAERSILVEGPSDELVVQIGYRQKHKKLPLEDGVEVISVGTSFKRFLDIAQLLKLDVDIIRDNDGDAAGKKALFVDYAADATIHINIDDDNAAPTLEPQLIKFNGLSNMNFMLEKTFPDTGTLLTHCTANKTDVALKLYEYNGIVKIPTYIQDAIR
ncbi:MAG TPA: AAA family ATPase [Mesorhizobium sp.]|jgi:predicted ATPase|uniref:ATP-dependent nuclease n=1 Tax=Mesorhizobium sp. TaxID=1871066 RepID=UPI002DDD6812|nr:AAA family ATPase [Mesorhizobium sp.]HEV2503714.1 AAA family ATPase [Mesorhizobium sp.]